ncbi:MULTISPECIES: dethiobiotin synthase [unclassified Actinopolyspora]|uniref:dethiobiotin synthase n=1 Tax=unclassified Actinopolyspora TaxID=2639451 RepID=UPI0013F629E6|nr:MULTISPECIES: dethiobiotin synthase [unclassified Actinopolyspora]NHD17904.1 ATP-dependent dethiobiotin synthetase BioD [Actinopolyspora sp. BKK2]NHE77777.1 ATP-dependent dethiobiotin synthetase BioD [Actinopolyspora sp. BKK1]
MAPTPLFVTGTGTDVGKTVVTAAVAALARGPVAVVKPAQTGTRGGGDCAEVLRLAGGVDVLELARYPDPLAPATAARLAGEHPVTPELIAGELAELPAGYGTVLVEGAGGVLVPYDDRGGTLLDVAELLGGAVLVVCPPGLGTLNSTALTVREVLRRGLRCPGTVFGSWPAEPGTTERCNLVDLPRLTGVPLLGAVEENAADHDREGFGERARCWLAPELGGTWRAPD